MSDSPPIATADSAQSLAGLWAKRYVQKLQTDDIAITGPKISSRSSTTEKLQGAIRFASSQAWAKTERLLVQEVQRHQINPDLIDPWCIAEDSRRLFEKALHSYETNVSPQRFSAIISSDCGQIRRMYTRKDPRILGFMSMQFHYTGCMLLEHLTPLEKYLVRDYFKVIDDHLYMPLQRSYEAAGDYEFESPILEAVRSLLSASTCIAEYLCDEAATLHPYHRCSSGFLNDPQVRISSIRDVEMFQLYLCLCAMEGTIDAVQQELFPLCVMLYPPLQVSWTLVRELVRLLTREIRLRLSPSSYRIFLPYLQALGQMFSAEVLPDCPTQIQAGAEVGRSELGRAELGRLHQRDSIEQLLQG
jgi:hypothetical protein